MVIAVTFAGVGWTILYIIGWIAIIIGVLIALGLFFRFLRWKRQWIADHTYF